MLTTAKSVTTDDKTTESPDSSPLEPTDQPNPYEPGKTEGLSGTSESGHGGVFLEPRFTRIPLEIQREFKWAVWLAEPRTNQPGKFKKAPRSPSNGSYLKVNNPDSFSDFEACQSAVEQNGYTGVGLLLEGKGWVGVDIDNFTTMSSADKEPILNWIKMALAKGAYVERSPSGSGIRAIFKGAFIGRGRKVGDLEIYQTGRFLTITGHAIERDEGDRCG